jgi:amino acid transporter
LPLTSPEPSPIAARLAKNRLGTLAIAGFILSATAPVAAVAGIIPTGYATTGILGIPLAILLIGVVLALFSVGFTAMSRRISNAGAFYAYVAQGIGKPLGVATAVVATLAYNLLQVGFYGAFGAAVMPLFNPRLGIAVPWWAWALGAWAVVAVLGVKRIDLNGHILSALMVMEIMLIAIFDFFNAAQSPEGSVSFAAFEPSALLVPGAGALFVIAITGFVGFEASAIFSEEARDPVRTVPRATYLCLAVTAVVYSLSAWAMTVATGPNRITAVATRDGSETIFNLADANIGPGWSTLGHILFATSVFAAMVSYHNAVGRYTFALGRENVLPAVFGTTTRKGAPKWGSLTQSIIGLAVIVGYALAGLDPLVQLFFWCGTTGGFGVLLLLTITSAAVIGYHLRHGGANLWRGVFAPILALVALAFIAETAATNFATLLGISAESPLGWIFPSSYLLAAGAGLIWAGVLRRTRPGVYRTIGLGANSVTGRVTGVEDTSGTHGLRRPQ